MFHSLEVYLQVDWHFEYFLSLHLFSVSEFLLHFPGKLFGLHFLYVNAVFLLSFLSSLAFYLLAFSPILELSDVQTAEYIRVHLPLVDVVVLSHDFSFCCLCEEFYASLSP